MSIKNGMLVTVLGGACAIFLVSPVFGAGMGAQQKTQQQQGMQQQQQMQQPVAYESSKLIGQDVVNQQGEQLGKIRNLAISTNGQVSYAVLGVGGLAGMGEQEVAVPFNQLQISPDQERITLNVSKDQVTSEFAAFEEIRQQMQQQQQQMQQDQQQQMQQRPDTEIEIEREQQ